MKKIILILIMVLAFALRFWKLDVYPALNADEAAIGYNAYSLIETGRDEHGNPWPVHFQSFNDFKPGLYFYLTIPFIKLMGLTEWAVRIPGAALGVGTVYLVYLLAYELFKKNDYKLSAENLSLTASFFLAISPWHIHFSRGGWEVNIATFFITLGIILFLKALEKSKLYVFSFISFALALYAYHSARIIVPLLGLGLVVIYFGKAKQDLKKVLLAGIVALVLLVPLLKDLTGPAGLSRASGVGLFADQGPLNRVNEQRGEHADFTSLVTKLIHNKPVNYTLAFIQNWIEHYHGEFLFLSGDDIQRNKVPETGQMYMIDFVFVVLGVFLLLRSLKSKSTQLILFWLIVAPVAAALTFQSPHALRSQNMVIPLIIISSLGANYLISMLNTKKLGVLSLGVALLVIWSGLRYSHIYWNHLSKEYPFSSQYGVKELVTYLTSTPELMEKNVMVTDRFDQPYILFLFYLKYDPAKFQGEHTLTAKDHFGFSTVRSFGRYTFTSITNWNETRQEHKDSLVAGTDEEIFEGTNVIKDIYGTNGFKYFQVVAN